MSTSRDHGELAERMNSIVRHLDRIEGKRTEIVKDLRNHLEARVESAVDELSDYLKSDDVKARFTTWTSDEVPKAEGSWEETNSNITNVLKKRLRKVIENWEEDHHVFSDARKSLLQLSQQRYNIVVGQLRNLQCAVINDDLDVPETISSKEGLTKAEKVVIGVTSPIWVPLSLVTLVIGAPVVGVLEIIDKLAERSRLKKYERDQCAFMAEESANYLDEATNKTGLKLFVKYQLKEAEMCLRKIEDRIPELIEADKMLYKELSDVRLSQIEIQKLYQPILDEASDIRGHLAVFALNDIRAIDISSEELDWREDNSSLLGCGSFAVVYQGKMRRQGKEQTVALKVCRKELDVHNARLIIAEVNTLR